MVKISKVKKGNTYEIIPSYDIANHNYYSITNNPGLKAIMIE